MNNKDSSSQCRRYATPPPESMPLGQSYSPPPPAPLCIAKTIGEIAPAADFVWHEINTGHSIMNPKHLKVPVLGSGCTSIHEIEDKEVTPRLYAKSSTVVSRSFFFPELSPPGSPDDVIDDADDDMPPLPSSINLAMRTDARHSLSPRLSMRCYENGFIPVRHDCNDVYDEDEGSMNGRR